MNEERTGKCLQVEHIRGHLGHIYSIASIIIIILTGRCTMCVSVCNILSEYIVYYLHVSCVKSYRPTNLAVYKNVDACIN